MSGFMTSTDDDYDNRTFDRGIRRLRERQNRGFSRSQIGNERKNTLTSRFPEYDPR